MKNKLEGIVTLDFETYYSQEYSLSKLTTEEYIRDSKFEVIGMALQYQDDTPRWITGDYVQIAARLNSLPWGQLGCVMHHAMFDAAVLNWRFSIRPAAIFDTLSMARPLVGAGFRVGLGALAEHFGLGQKGTEVLDAKGKHRRDFSVQELARYGEYSKNDVALTWKLFQLLLRQGFPMDELRLIDQTIRMFTEPVLRLNHPALVEYGHALERARKAQLENAARSLGREDLAIRVVVGDTQAQDELQKMLRSDAQFAELLGQLGVVPPTKISPRTGKEAFAFAKTDAGMMALLEHDEPAVQALAAARVGVKTTIEESRTQRFIDISQRGPFPVPLKYCAALTLRWGGTDKINMQNLSSRSAAAGQLKRCIQAPEGHVIIDCDSAQIEARVLPWWAGQWDLVEAFEQRRDVYSEMATKIYGRPIDRKRVEKNDAGEEFYPDKVEGFVGKTAVLGCGYSAGGARFREMLRVQAGLDVTLEEATRIVETYRMSVPRIVQLWRDANKAIEYMAQGMESTLGAMETVRVTYEGLVLPNGLPIRYRGLRRVRDEQSGFEEWEYMQGAQPVRLYGAKLVENTTQALARIIVGQQLLRIAKRYRVVMTVHDSVGIVAKIEEARVAREYVEECMRWAPSWAKGLPLNCESNVGLAYGAW